MATIFLVNKDEKENRETVLDLPNVLVVLYTKDICKIHLPNCLFLLRNITRTFGTMELEVMFHCV